MRAGATILTAAAFSRTAGAVEARWNRLPWFWRIQIIGWGVFSLVDLVNLTVLYRDFPVALARTVAVVGCLVAVATLMRQVYASRHLANMLSPRAMIWIMLLSGGGGLAIAGLLQIVSGPAGWTLAERDPVEAFLFPLTHYSIVLAGWSLGYFWIHAEIAEQTEHKHAVRAEAEALRAELEKLRLQLDPHFLFNALNGVAEEIPEQPMAALAMLRDLTAYLRHSLDGIDQTVASVDAEVGGFSSYLRVQQARFGERLRVTLEIDQEARSCRIASFLLQPLVENAIKHGKRDTGLEVRIDIRLAGDTLRIEIENTGSLSGPTSPRQRRIRVGLDNVRRRLALHYPGRHHFSLSERTVGPNTVVAALVLEGEPCSGS
jgi:two-component system LytT family sensor kinase